ncbi:MAG TPA: alpha/beta hydrolase [Thermoanaerobaculia bacterium]
MFEISSREGLPIRGDIDAPPQARAAVVIIHGFGAFKDWGFFPWLSEYLCASGAVAARFNMSRSGIGDVNDRFDRLDLFRDDTYTIQIHDLLDVVAYTQSRFRGVPLFLLGHSRGGGIALLAAREIEDLAGVVTWSGISRADRWDDVDVTATAVLADFEANRQRLDILDSASQLRVPLLAIHGASDKSVPADDSRAIVAKATDSSLLTIEGASHTFNAIHPLVHVPRALELAAVVSSHFIAAYS